jgi:predicted nucleic acid-binding protein
VRLELWRGANGPIDDEVLRGFEADLVRLEMSAAVWDHACELGRRCRRSVRPVPQSDLMIFACSVVHGVELLRRDHHFDLLRTL